MLYHVKKGRRVDIRWYSFVLIEKQPIFNIFDIQYRDETSRQRVINLTSCSREAATICPAQACKW